MNAVINPLGKKRHFTPATDDFMRHPPFVVDENLSAMKSLQRKILQVNPPFLCVVVFFRQRQNLQLMQALIEHGTYCRRPLQIQMRHIIKTIVADRQIKQVDHFEIIRPLQHSYRLTKMIQHVTRIIAPNDRRIRKQDADRLRSVVETQFDVILENLNVLLDRVGIKRFVVTVDDGLIIRQPLERNIFVEGNLFLHAVRVGILLGSSAPNSSDAVIDQIEKNFIVLGLRLHIFERQQILQIARMNSKRFLTVIAKRIRHQTDQNKLYEIIMMGGATSDIQKHVEQSDILDGGLDWSWRG